MLALLAINTLLAIFLGNLGKNRTIGYWGAFLVCIVTSPIVGLLIIFSSPKTKPFEEKINNNTILSQSVSKEFQELEQKRKEGNISEDEYRKKKAELLKRLTDKATNNLP